MTRIAAVSLPFNPKILWFDAGSLKLTPGSFVVVHTARGLELGKLMEEVFEATDDQVEALPTDLCSVEREATQQDIEQAKKNEELAKQALIDFKKIVSEQNSEMHPVSVEYLLDGSQAVFYFESEQRVDFREVVRQLASRLHVRVDMRQIGVRDEARIIGGYGHCGQKLCCARIGSEKSPVSIKMAKEQGLSLNPQKISGMCGRLQCCLRYEFEAYKEFNKRAPKLKAKIDTPEGIAKVIKLDVPQEKVQLKLDTPDGKSKVVTVPLASFDKPKEGNRPQKVGNEAWEAALAPKDTYSDNNLFFTGNFIGNDKLGEARAVHSNRANSKNATGSVSMIDNTGSQGKKRRRRRTSKKLSSGQDHTSDQKRDFRIGNASNVFSRKSKKDNQDNKAHQNKKDKKGFFAKRPGQKSSSLRGGVTEQYDTGSSNKQSSGRENSNNNVQQKYRQKRRNRSQENNSGNAESRRNQQTELKNKASKGAQKQGLRSSSHATSNSANTSNTSNSNNSRNSSKNNNSLGSAPVPDATSRRKPRKRGAHRVIGGSGTDRKPTE